MDGTASGVGLAEAGVWSVGNNGSTDPMYSVFAYVGGFDIILTLTNLVAGPYQGVFDFYLYGHGGEDDQNGVFQLAVDDQSYGTEMTASGPGWLSAFWQKGVQYVEFTNVMVNSGQTVTITAAKGDTGLAVLSGLQIGYVMTLPTNGLPVMIITPNQVANANQELILTNYAYSARGPISFTLESNAPAGAAITPDGILTWEPACEQGSTTNLITVWATDSSNPPLSNSMTFSVVVGECVEVIIGSSVTQAGRGACVPVSLLTTVPLTNLSFSFASPTGFFTNWNISSTNSAIASTTVGEVASQPQFNFGVQSRQVLQGTSVIGSICVDTLSVAASAFVPLVVANINAMASNNSPATNSISQKGRVVVIGPQSLLEALPGTNPGPTLTLYGRPGLSYDLFSTTNLIDEGSWSIWGKVTLSELSQVISLGSATNQMQFFRAVEP
jgi:hypothetical protein